MPFPKAAVLLFREDPLGGTDELFAETQRYFVRKLYEPAVPLLLDLWSDLSRKLCRGREGPRAVYARRASGMPASSSSLLSFLYISGTVAQLVRALL